MGGSFDVHDRKDRRQVNENIIVLATRRLEHVLYGRSRENIRILDVLIRAEAGKKSNLKLISEITRSLKSDLSATILSNPGAFEYPSALVMEGFRKSASIKRVRAPALARKAAKLVATVVLPSPGSADTIPMILAPVG